MELRINVSGGWLVADMGHSTPTLRLISKGPLVWSAVQSAEPEAVELYILELVGPSAAKLLVRRPGMEEAFLEFDRYMQD
mmetsp:Transcript_62227/g.187769  ORF Transcript_62227/g.187769 Transcript_62227/m.187769 type:complete len:80 (-) Transcript_62227:88-327(-)